MEANQWMLTPSEGEGETQIEEAESDHLQVRVKAETHHKVIDEKLQHQLPNPNRRPRAPPIEAATTAGKKDIELGTAPGKLRPLLEVEEKKKKKIPNPNTLCMNGNTPANLKTTTGIRIE